MGRILVVGDLHCKKQIWAGRPDIRGDVESTIRQLVEVVRDRQGEPRIGTVVFAGDTFDDPYPMDEVVRTLQKAVQELHAMEVFCLGITGNPGHDQGTDWLNVCGIRNAVVPSLLPLEGVPTYLIPFTADTEALQKTLAQCPPDAKLLIGHQMGRWIIDIPGRWNLDPEWLPAWIKLAVFGDSHMPSEHKVGDKTLIYTGSLYPLGLDELSPRSFLVLNEGLSYCRIPVKNRRIVYRDILGASQLQSDLAKLVADLKPTAADDPELKPLAAIRLAEAAAGDEGKVRAAVEPVASLMLIPSAKEKIEVTVAESDEVRTDLQILQELEGDSETVAFASTLLQSADPRKILSDFRDKCVAPKEVVSGSVTA